MKKKIVKLLSLTSGRPNNEEIIEKIKVWHLLLHPVLSVVLMITAINTGRIIYGLFAIIFAWQMGWGMSIERFKKSEKED